MRVELTRFRVVPGKSERVDAWLGMLNERMPETLATLEREKMHVEVIFRERVDDEEFLSWLSIQGEGGEHVRTSHHEIDKLHLEFWDECIDATYGAHDAVPQVVMVPAAISTAIGWAEPKAAAVAWVGQSTWRRPRQSADPERANGSE